MPLCRKCLPETGMSSVGTRIDMGNDAMREWREAVAKKEIDGVFRDFWRLMTLDQYRDKPKPQLADLFAYFMKEKQGPEHLGSEGNAASIFCSHFGANLDLNDWSIEDLKTFFGGPRGEFKRFYMFLGAAGAWRFDNVNVIMMIDPRETFDNKLTQKILSEIANYIPVYREEYYREGGEILRLPYILHWLTATSMFDSTSNAISPILLRLDAAVKNKVVPSEEFQLIAKQIRADPTLMRGVRVDPPGDARGVN